ncbi:MAG: YceH family protein [Cocleimonas sp.]|nr:YceH family protein [Cocleimonas sp.]
MDAKIIMDDSLITEKSIVNEDQKEGQKAFFTPLEARVIASLMEKHLTTPNNYPLTMNSLTNACNQKSNREPVMNLTEGQIGHTINLLVERKLAGLEYGERANKIIHRVCTELDLDRKQQAVLTVLMLRTPQTLNDLKTRTARMADFSGAEEVQDVINSLIEREETLVTLIPKGAGRREERFAHTLCGEIKIENITAEPTMIDAVAIENDHLDALEARILVIEEKLGITLDLG